MRNGRRNWLILLLGSLTMALPVIPGAKAEIGPGDPPTTFAYLRSSDGGDHFSRSQLNDVGPETEMTHVAASDGVVHAVFETVEQPRQVHYRRSTDGGHTFDGSIRLDDNIGDSSESTVAVDGRAVHVVWEDDRLLPDGDIDPCCEKPFAEKNRDEVFYARSSDGGRTFSDPVNLTDAVDIHDRDPDVAVDGDLVVVAYEGLDLGSDPDNEDDEVLLRRSRDGGGTWEAELNLSQDPGEQDEPAVSVSGTTVHVSFRDKSSGSLGYARSTDGGASFASFVTLPGSVEESDVLALGTRVYVVACTVLDDDAEDASAALVLYRSTDDGASFRGPVTVTDLDDECGEPAIAGVGDELHVSFELERAEEDDIFYARGRDGGRRWTEPVNLSANHEKSENPSVAVDPEDPDSVHVSWVDASTFLFALRTGQELPLADGEARWFADEDVIRYVGGAYEMVLNGSDVGLADLRIDALATLPPTDEDEPATEFVLSFAEPGEVPGVGSVDNSDLVLFTADRLGNDTRGTFSLYFEGSDIGLNHSGEDVDAVAVEVADEGIDIYMSTTGTFGIGDRAAGEGADVFVCRDATTGAGSTCENIEKAFDGSRAGLSTGVDAFSFDRLGNTNQGSAFFSTDGPFSVDTATGGPSDVLRCRFTEEDEEDGTVDTSLPDCGGDLVPLLKVFRAQTHGIEENLAAVAFEY